MTPSSRKPPVPANPRSAAARALRVRLAGALEAAGDKPAAARIYGAILAGDAPAPQKKAARMALEAWPEIRRISTPARRKPEGGL